MIKRFLKITIASLVLLSMVAFVLFSSFEAKADGSFSGGGSSTDESGDTVYTLNDGGRLDYSETTGSFNYVTFKFRPNSYMGSDDQAHLTLYISSGSSIVSFRLLNYWKALDIVDYAQDYSSSTKLMEFANYANNGGGGWTQTDAWVDVKIGFNVNGFYYSVGGTEFFIPNNNHYDLSNKAIWFGCWSCTPSFKDFTLSNNDEWHANAWRGNCDVALEDDKPVYTVNTGGVNRINYLGLTHADTVEFKVKYPADYAGDTTNLSFYVANGTETMRIYTFPFYNYFQVEKYNADVSVCTLQGISGNYTNVGTHGVWDPVNEWLTIKIEFANKHTAVYLNSVKVFETCANYGFDYTNTNFYFTAWGCLLSIKDIVLSDNSLQPSHTPVEDAAVPATCTTAGKTAGSHCSACNEVLVSQEDIEALGHLEVIDNAVAATCTTAGKTEGKHCSRCSEVLVPQEDIEALGHLEVIDNAVAATCTEKGKTAGSHCSRCSAVLEAQEDIAELGHNASSQTYHTNDKHFNICTRCGFALDFEDQTVQTDYTDARWTQRKYTSDWVAMSGQMRVREKNGSKVVNMAAGYSTTMQYILNFGGSTPIAKGNSFSIDLGNYFSGAKPMGVKISLVVKVASTTQTIYILGSADNYYNFHVTTGFETFTYVGNMEVEIYEIRITNNSQNNGSFYLYMDNLRIFTAMNTADHTMVDDPSAPAQAATCTEAGKEVGKMCSCGYKVEGSSIPANGHTEAIDAAVAPTCTETGLTQGKHCSVCNAILVPQEVVPANGHTEVVDEAVAPTCTQAGKTAGKHCSVCNEVLVAQQEVAALGHTEVIDAAVASTCTEKGKTEGKHCSVCNEVLVAQQEVAALGHDLVDDAAVAPTCTEAGKTAGHHCSRCDYKDGGEVVAATGHDWGEWVQTKAPSATEEGEEKRTCKNDPSHTETRPIDRTPVITTTEEPAPVTTTEAPAPETTTKAPVTEAPAPVKKGCKGALVPSIVGVVLLLGSIVVIKRKREE